MEVKPIGVHDAQQQQSPQFTAREKRDELARECNLRKSVYPGQVRQGRMTHAQAERQKAIMHAIWQDYCAIVSAEKSEPQRDLDLAPDHESATDDNATTRQPLNAMAHAGDGDGALREAGGGEVPSSYPTGESTSSETPHAVDSSSSSD